MYLNFEADSLSVGKDVINLDCSSSGHYLLPLCFWLDLNSLSMISIDDKDVHSVALKLHKQFGHASSDKLIK